MKTELDNGFRNSNMFFLSFSPCFLVMGMQSLNRIIRAVDNIEFNNGGTDYRNHGEDFCNSETDIRNFTKSEYKINCKLTKLRQLITRISLSSLIRI